MAKPKIKPRFTPPTTVQLLAQATAHQAAHRYKDLIEVYKELLQRETRLEWQTALAQAYGQRARALAAKGMYREAVAMWESSRTSTLAADSALAVGWMLAAGMNAQAATLLREIPILPMELQNRIGVALLIGRNELASGLADDAPLIRHLLPARAALEAWCQGDDTTAREQLRAIPFRSPYRELRQILHGLLTADQEPLEAILVNSPYIGLARAALAARAPLAGLEKRITSLCLAEQELAAVLRGVDPAQLRIILDLRSALTSTNENLAPLFRWVTTQPAPVPEEQARRFALAILPHQPKLLEIFQKRFGALNPFEHARLRALVAERDEDLEKAQTFWKQTFNACDLKDATGTLMGAMILRHQATLETQMYGPEEPEVIKYLQQSLQLDPLDRASWLQIINHHRSTSNSQWQTLAEQALEHLPNESELLFLAAQGAAERGSYKKASGYVTTLLQIDPINIGARRLLIRLHLSHARKSLKTKKIAIVMRELAAAQNLVNGGADGTRVTVHQAFLAIINGSPQAARDFAVQATHGPSGGMGTTLLSRVEGQLAGIKAHDLLALTAGLPEAQPTASQVVALLELLEELQPLNLDLVVGVVKSALFPSLRAAATHHDYTEDQLTRLFDILHKGLYWELIVAYAATALKRWPGRPIFVFYHYLGSSHGQSNRLAKRDLTVLENARDTALEADDVRTARLIDTFLERFIRRFPWRNRHSDPSASLPPEIHRLMEDMSDTDEEFNPTERIRDMLKNLIERVIGKEESESESESGKPRRGRKK